jgi:hypothetical protein
MVLGGIVMPIGLSIPLILGGLIGVCHDKEKWQPFWSGIFAANSIWMIVKIFF